MTNLIEQLRASCENGILPDDVYRAADELERLASQLESANRAVQIERGKVEKADRENDRLTRELSEMRERLSAAESKEVCTVAHSDEVLEFCPYCKIELLRERLEARDAQMAALKVEEQPEYLRLRGLLLEWFYASDPSIRGSPGSLLERTRNALYPVGQSEVLR